MLSTSGLAPVAHELSGPSVSGSWGSESKPVRPEWPSATIDEGYGESACGCASLEPEPDEQDPQSPTAGNSGAIQARGGVLSRAAPRLRGRGDPAPRSGSGPRGARGVQYAGGRVLRPRSSQPAGTCRIASRVSSARVA